MRIRLTSLAVVRSPDKLRKLLAERHVIETTIVNNLTIIEGNVKDLAAVQKALLLPLDSKRMTDIIVSGVGAAPRWNWSLTQPLAMDDPNICEHATRTILQAVSVLQSEGVSGKPSMTVVSTTGIDKVRDVPLLFAPMYWILLATPHHDKRAMEDALEATSRDQAKSPIKGYVAVKPSLLIDGTDKGLPGVRVGWHGGEVDGHGPAVGYTITRNDVGNWIFQNLVQSSERDQWLGRKVTLTS